MTDRRYVLCDSSVYSAVSLLYLATKSTVVIIHTTCCSIKNFTTQCINVFRLILTISTNYLPKQH
jgi:hypothetical protein